MIELRTAELTVTVDPAHGAEVRRLVVEQTGADILGHPPFVPGEPVGGDLDEETWTKGYRGGWQIAAPNAGNACTVDRDHHGFHGRASVDPWDLIAFDEQRAVMRWRGHGLELTRTLTVDGASVCAELTWTALGEPAPLIAVEHIAFGAQLLDPGCTIVIDAAAHELSESEGPQSAPDRAPRWPELLRTDGTIEHLSPPSSSRPRAVFAALTDVREGRATLANSATGLAVELRWDAAALANVWLWEEIRTTGGPWRQDGVLLGFEPASVPHSLGLAAAIEHGQAYWARQGTLAGHTLTLSVLTA